MIFVVFVVYFVYNVVKLSYTIKINYLSSLRDYGLKGNVKF